MLDVEFSLFWSIISTIAYIILILVDSNGVKYFAIIIAIGGLSPCTSICISFLSCNVSPHVKRATALAFILSMCNTGGVIGGQIYRAQDEPRFIFGHSINVVCCIMSLITAAILVFALYLENQHCDRLYGKVQNFAMLNTDTSPSDIFSLGSEKIENGGVMKICRRKKFLT